MNCHADLRGRVAVAAERHHALNEIGVLLRNRQRTPAQLRRRGVDIVERCAANEPIVDARIGPVYDRRLNAVGPGAPVFRARRRERGAGNQLGIKSVRRPLRRILPDRQCAWHRLGGEVVAEAGLISGRAGAFAPLLRLVGPADLGVVFGHIGHRTSQAAALAVVRGAPGLAPANWSRTQLSAFGTARASHLVSLLNYPPDTAVTARFMPSARMRCRRSRYLIPSCFAAAANSWLSAISGLGLASRKYGVPSAASRKSMRA